jgi:hypothetical protein
MSDCVLLGNRDYLSKTIQLDLFQTVNIKLDLSQRRSKRRKGKIRTTINHKLISLENQGKELKHYFHNCVTSSKLEIIMLNLLRRV